jgi:exodeoxyribonuclease-5
MSKRPKSASKRLTQGNPEALGTERLVALLMELADSQPNLKRRLRMELAATRSEIDDIKDSGVLESEPGAVDRIAELEAEASKIEREMKGAHFELNPESEWADADLIVLDEVSMVDTKMATDIESLGVPVLVLGAPAQLPPVGGAGYYIDAEPDVLLTEIHRQALESPVLRLATAIRLGQPHDVVPETASITRAMEHDQVLCWRNATRWKLIERMRAKAGKPAGVPVIGDRVMCLVNNKKDLGIFNGQQFEVLAVDGEELLLAEIGVDGPARWISAFPEGFAGMDGEAGLKDRRAFRGTTGAFTFADAITTHKARTAAVARRKAPILQPFCAIRSAA